MKSLYNTWPLCDNPVSIFIKIPTPFWKRSIHFSSGKGAEVPQVCETSMAAGSVNVDADDLEDIDPNS